ncbi:MAG: hypothetical protein WBW31_21610 [Candidatus Sulfotelmatobacter sp.]
MLQAHSLLWHYLWVAPDLLLLFLAILLWRRKFHRQYPVFLIFAVAAATASLAVCAADEIRSVSANAFWRVDWASLLVDALVKFALIGEIFGRVFGLYPSLAKLGKSFITGVGVVLVLLATLAAADTPKDNINLIVSGAHILEQTIYLIECGLILFLFVFAAYFKLSWSRSAFGITLGLGVSASVHLATWALMANGKFPAQYRISLDFLNMAAYHVSVLIWFYYLLVPEKNISGPVDPPPPGHDLEIWNQELERLLHK